MTHGVVKECQFYNLKYNGLNNTKYIESRHLVLRTLVLFKENNLQQLSSVLRWAKCQLYKTFI
ncbi:hypothetical protein T4A_13164 [Trichinella pseudospiralis]|uniref:Uncharacterized protein n=1 Tax=Trichinella pseudospiralis TaxID=6337 RepID=A0A0V1DQT1_TRIPS|nr:hypothetical protein T4A_13164 [Trichinella pseudospiralis]